MRGRGVGGRIANGVKRVTMWRENGGRASGRGSEGIVRTKMMRLRKEVSSAGGIAVTWRRLLDELLQDGVCQTDGTPQVPPVCPTRRDPKRAIAAFASRNRPASGVMGP